MAWVDNREIELLKIMADLVLIQNAGTILTLDRSPVGKITKDEMDAVLLYEGPDHIEGHANTNTLGNQTRVLTLMFELWVHNESNDISTVKAQLRSLYNEVRIAAMRKKNVTEKNLTNVYTSSVPGVIGIGLVMELRYVNNGNEGV